MHLRWGTTAELLAGLLQLTDLTNRQYHAVHFKPPHPDPIEVTRPGPKKAVEKPRPASVAEMKEFFGGVSYTPTGV